MEDLTLVPGGSPITQKPSTLESSNRVKCKKMESIKRCWMLMYFVDSSLSNWFGSPFLKKKMLDSILSQANLRFLFGSDFAIPRHPDRNFRLTLLWLPLIPEPSSMVLTILTHQTLNFFIRIIGLLHFHRATCCEMLKKRNHNSHRNHI